DKRWRRKFSVLRISSWSAEIALEDKALDSKTYEGNSLGAIELMDDTTESDMLTVKNAE
ncbi:hypothetical protein CEXT_75011, partial [Caerostris extrusa]